MGELILLEFHGTISGFSIVSAFVKLVCDPHRMNMVLVCVCVCAVAVVHNVVNVVQVVHNVAPAVLPPSLRGTPSTHARTS
jgi:hypothetical protein